MGTINGTPNGETLYGTNTDDTIFGQEGRDQIYADAGNDYVDLGIGDRNGSQYADGGEGNDTLVGGSSADQLYGGVGQDSLFGGDGNDNLDGASGDDYMDGGAGDDYFTANEGNDIIIGGSGEDFFEYVSYNVGQSTLTGGAGVDTFRVYGYRVYGGGYSAWGPDTITDFQAGNGGDILRLDTAINGFLTGWNPDTNPFTAGFLRFDVQDIDGDGQADDAAFQIDADGAVGGGTWTTVLNLLNLAPSALTIQNFTMYGDHPAWAPNGTGVTIALPQELNNTSQNLLGSLDADLLTGSDETEYLYGYSGDDTLIGLGGSDQLYGDSGNDLLQGGAGNDYLTGGAGNDTLDGGNGNDDFYDEDGNDVVIGGQGNDSFHNGAGADTFDGGEGNDSFDMTYNSANFAGDLFTGGAGQNSYYFALYPTYAGYGTGIPVITDFHGGTGGDTLRLGYSYLLSGLGDANPFVSGYLKLVAADVDGDSQVDDVYLQVDFDGGGAGYAFQNIVGFLNTTPAAFGAAFQLDGDNQIFGTTGTGYTFSSAIFANSSIGGTRDGDSLTASDYGASLYGYRGNDTLIGGAAGDGLYGYEGNDSAVGNAGNDSFQMHDGNDTAIGGDGNDSFYMGTGFNVVFGGAGNDYVYLAENFSGVGGDQIDLGDGNDYAGYVGYDTVVSTLTLGAGRDQVELHARIFNDPNVQVDIVNDFVGGVNGDLVNLNNTVAYFQGFDNSTNPFATGYMRLIVGDIDSDGNDDTLLQVDRDGGGNSYTTILAFRDITPAAFDAYNFLRPNYGPNPGFNSDAYTSDTRAFLDPTPGGANHAPTADDVTIVLITGQQPYYQPSIGWAKSLLDADGDAITANITTPPTAGVLTFNADGSLNYNGSGVAPGTYTFGYTISDGIATVNKTGTIQVLADNNADFNFTGGIGNDGIGGDEGQNVLNGGAGDDNISAAGNNDTINGGSGDDYLDGGAGNDVIFGDDGNDRIQGSVGDDTGHGGAGNDQFEDYLGGNNRYFGDAGDDTFEYLNYGSGVSTLSGGTGRDNFVLHLNQALNGGGQTVITDFAAGPGGDFLTLGDYTSVFSNYQTQNAFATGQLKFVQVGLDTVLRGDPDGDGIGAIDLITFQNATATAFSIDNIRIPGAPNSSGVDPQGQTFTITGSPFGEGLTGTSGADIIHGDPDFTDILGGADQISGGWGGDTIFGHAGNDLIYGDAGADLINGGDGDDRAYGGEQNDTLNGGAGNDELHGDSGDDVLNGGTGDDYLEDSADGDSDIMHGNDGDDYFLSYYGNTQLFGDAGNDYFANALTPYDADAHTVATGGTGTDTYEIYGYSLRSGWTTSLTITDFQAGIGGDVLKLQDLTSLFTGWDQTSNPFAGGFLRFVAVDADGDSKADDTLFQYDITGSSDGGQWLTLATLLDVDPTKIVSANLNTSNFGQGAFWHPDGTASIVNGTDRPDNDQWNPALVGTLGNDVMNGFAGNENLYGLRGDDLINGGEGGDFLQGNEGNDTIFGDNGNDVLYGSTGADSLVGGAGNDDLRGDEGDDTLLGGAGDDYFYDYAGANVMDGGAGADYFANLSATSAASKVTGGADRDFFQVLPYAFYYDDANHKADVITDFQNGAAGDILDLSSWTGGNGGWLDGWDPGTNPFSTGYVRFQAVDADSDGQVDDIAVQGDRDGKGATFGFTDGVFLLNVKAEDIVRSQIIFQNGLTWSQTGADGIPNSVNDEYLAIEDTKLTIAGPGVLANDSDPQGDPITAVLESGPSHGTLTLNSDGSFAYTPFQDFSGDDSFTYRAKDATSPGNLATVTIHVDNENDPAIANPNSYTVKQDNTLSVPDGATDVLANDFDPDGDPLTATLKTGPQHGSLTLNANGSFDYTPTAGYFGTDSFTYVANDGTLDSAPATVTITVEGTNVAPVAKDDGPYAATEDTKLTVTAANGVLANDTDANGDKLSAGIVSSAFGGTVVLAADGSFEFTPTANFQGTASFQYRVNDGSLNSNVATVTIAVANVNDAPVANADGPYAATEDTKLSVNAANGVLANDFDVDGDTLSAQLVSTTSNGMLTLNADGSFDYQPGANYSGSDSFSYQAKDPSGALSNTRIVQINVAAQNDAPVGKADSYAIAEDAVLQVAAPGVLGNDTDADGDSLTASLVSGVSHGALSLKSDGSFTYTPTANYSGADSFTYKVSDGTAQSGTVTVTIDVTPTNDAPVAQNDGYNLNEDSTLNVAAPGVLTNDFDVDGDTLTVQLVAGVSHGVLSLKSDGSFSYTPDANYNGGDSFTYKVSDGTLSSGTQTVFLNVAPQNDLPIAVDDSGFVTPYQTAIKFEDFQLLDNDSDIDGDFLVLTSVQGAVHGTVGLDAENRPIFTPDNGYSGAASFTYTISDGNGGTDTATVNLTVGSPGNTPPSGIADQYATDEDTKLSVSAAAGVLSNDSDSDGDSLSASLVAGPAHGTLSFKTDGSFDYTPFSNYNGADSFTYKVSDGTSSTGPVTVTLTVNAVNDAPVADADGPYAATEDTKLTVTAANGVLNGDTDVDGDTLTALIVSGTAHGSLVLNADGSFDYTPDANYNGGDSFSYQAKDSAGALSGVQTVTINVAPVNDAPVADPDGPYAATEDTKLTVTAANGVLNGDTDVDGDPLTAQLVTGPAHGSIVLNADGSFDYTPVANYNGADTFSYQAKDSAGALSGVQTVTINVAPVNDAPVADPDGPYAATEDTKLTVTAANGVLNGDTDVDGDPLTAQLVSGPAHGSLVLNADGSFDYTPVANYNGADSFSYQAKDSSGLLSAVQTVTIAIAAVNDAPDAVNDGPYATPYQTALVTSAATLLANDTDIDGDKLSVISAQNATHGTVSLVNGNVTFTPTAGYTGAASYDYSISDGNGGTDTATVSINVGSPDDYFYDTAANETWNGGVGNDTLSFENLVVVNNVGVTAALKDNVAQNNGPGGTNTLISIENLVGTSGNDKLTGDALANKLFGGAGADVLNGGAGNDTLNGGTGTDTITGGPGADRIIMQSLDGDLLGIDGDDLIDVSAFAGFNYQITSSAGRSFVNFDLDNDSAFDDGGFIVQGWGNVASVLYFGPVVAA